MREPLPQLRREATPLGKGEALELIRQLTAAAGSHDIERLVGFYSSDAVTVSPALGVRVGRDAIASSWRELFNTLGDIRIEIADVLLDGDRIAVLSNVSATIQGGGWFGYPALGGSVEYRLLLLLTVADGKIVRDERVYDSSNLLKRLEKVRLDEELNTAAEIQRALLPRTAFSGSSCHGAGRSISCRAIGGDFFEFLELPTGEIGLAIGDVAGKGPAAGILASLIQGMLSVEATIGGGPAAVLRRINSRLVARRVEGRFATLVYCVISPHGEITYSNAGHNPPALVSSGHIRRLTAGGPILGLLANATFEEEHVSLDGHELLVMFTDGITEAVNSAGEDYGDQRLIGLLQGAPDEPDAVLECIFDSVQNFSREVEQADDLTATVVRFS